MRPVPPVVWLVGVPIGALLGALLGAAIGMMALVSTMLSLLFTAMPAAVLHFLLRSLAAIL